MKDLIPRHFKALLVEMYDVTTDPYCNLEGYKSLMILQGTFGIFVRYMS